MLFQFIHSSFLFLSAYEVVQGCDYAHIDKKHTMCIFTPRMCHTRKLLRSGGLNCMEKQRIIQEHNLARQMIANGKVKGQPAAMNMGEMVWDEELARVSQVWADQCMPGHDHSRNVDRYAVGQNVATSWTFDKEAPNKDAPEFSRHIKGWFDEVYKYGFKPKYIDPFMFSMDTGHYTQLAWADTYMVGCGYSYYKDPKRGYSKLYVCNYGPGGNLIGQPMYKVGFPGVLICQGSGELTQSSRYLGLCEVAGGRYPDHMCSEVDAPPLVETPPSLHVPTPRPHQSIFHEMMGDNALSDIAMKSTHLLMMGVKHGMELAELFNPLSWAPRLTRPLQDLM